MPPKPSTPEKGGLNWKGQGVRAFTGSDITASMFLPYVKKPLRLGQLALFSWQTMRPKSLVGSLGRATGKGYTRGLRIITGVMVFLQLDRSPFAPLVDKKLRESLAP